MSQSNNSTPSAPPFRQIRAVFDEDTITVYQAYSVTIADAAVKAQKLDASFSFLLGRMTWIKPSWLWMMYRSGYSTKDPGQARILAIKMKHAHFLELLGNAVLTHGGILTAEQKEMAVRVQWDPERNPLLRPLSYRSIQIGIGRKLSKKWVQEWIVSIEDVTEDALRLKALLKEEPDVTAEELQERGVIPKELPYEIPEELRTQLRMDAVAKTKVGYPW